LTLAEAVHNSARFPYVSPASVVKMNDPDSRGFFQRLLHLNYWDRLGDGGYVEASGALTLVEIIRELEDSRLIRDADVPGTCQDSVPDDKCFITRDQVRVIVIDNAGTNGASYLCARDATKRRARPQNYPWRGSPLWPPVADATAPLLGAFSTRGGRGLGAQVELAKLVGGCTEQFAELRLPKPHAGQIEPSMNWMLDSASRRFMDSAVDSPHKGTEDRYVQLDDNLERVRSWLRPRLAP
jgi:hypothetical protein